MLLSEILGSDMRREFRVFNPEEMKSMFPMAYKWLV
jgi:hypothetical protein